MRKLKQKSLVILGITLSLLMIFVLAYTAWKTVFYVESEKYGVRLSRELVFGARLGNTETRYGMGTFSVSIEAITHLEAIHDLIADPPALAKYDLIFCDLGWSDLTLNGIQLLHDIQMAHPRIYTVLYTAQDEDAVISQALKWQLDFIDTVIKIDGNDYFKEMVNIIRDQFHRKVVEIVGGADVEMIRKRLAMYLGPKATAQSPKCWPQRNRSKKFPLESITRV